MKVTGEIVTVDTSGDTLTVTAQCRLTHEAKWRSPHVVTFAAPLNTAKSYYIGRKVELVIRVKP